jgi:hypothetical protein
MTVRMQRQAACAAAIVLFLSSEAVAQRQPQGPPTPQTRVEGQIHDFTAALDASGPWEISGEWSLFLNPSGRVAFEAALNMVRAENTTRQSHTHHVGLTEGDVTPITGGFRITGIAVITLNGALAGFSGSPITIDLTGGEALRFSNVKVTFGGGASGHFGDQPIDGVVSLR